MLFHYFFIQYFEICVSLAIICVTAHAAIYEKNFMTLACLFLLHSRLRKIKKKAELRYVTTMNARLGQLSIRSHDFMK